MKRSDKIAGIFSVIAIICTVIYLLITRLVFTVGSEVLYAVGLLIFVSFFAIFQHYLTIGLILRRRVRAFKGLAEKYSLKHSFVNNIFLIPYGKLNTLNGNIKGHTIEVTDDSFMPGMGKVAKYVALNQALPGYTSRKSLNMDTKISIDGQDSTPPYSQKWVLYRNPFMKVSEIESYLKGL